MREQLLTPLIELEREMFEERLASKADVQLAAVVVQRLGDNLGLGHGQWPIDLRADVRAYGRIGRERLDDMLTGLIAAYCHIAQRFGEQPLKTACRIGGAAGALHCFRQ